MMHPLKSFFPNPAMVDIVCTRLHLKPETPLIPHGDKGEYRIAGTDDLLRFGKNFSSAQRVRRYFAKVENQ